MRRYCGQGRTDKILLSHPHPDLDSGFTSVEVYALQVLLFYFKVLPTRLVLTYLTDFTDSLSKAVCV